jgi:hypothetical protein
VTGETIDIVHDFEHFEYSTHPICKHDDMLDALANIMHPVAKGRMRFPISPHDVRHRDAPARTINKRLRIIG